MLAKPVVEIAPRTWLISEYKLVNMYLLEGDEAALLVDCGTGIGNAAETVRELTDMARCVLYCSVSARRPGRRWCSVRPARHAQGCFSR